MAKKKLTINQQQWKKEMERIQRFQKSASKRGFYFPDDILPQQPKRITKQALKKLANITPEDQYAKAVYLDRDTGKMISGTEGRRQERSKAAKKGWQTRKYKATPRPKPDKPSTDADVDEPIFDSGSDEPRDDLRGGASPILDINSLIRAMDRALEMLTRYNTADMIFQSRVKQMRSTWDNTKERFKDHKHILEAYLAKHDVELQQCLDIIMYESNQRKVNQAINRLLELLNYNDPLSTETLKEFENENTDIDLTDLDLPYYDD